MAQKRRATPHEPGDGAPPARPKKGGRKRDSAPSEENTPARAKPNPQDARTRRDRVFFIAELMASNEWRPKRSKELAVEWGVLAVTVRAMAAEASRLLEYTTGDREQLVKLARLKLRAIIEGGGDEKVYAIRTLLEHLGELRTRQKVEMGGPDGGPIPLGQATVVMLPPKEPLEAGTPEVAESASEG
jgi:hypothetical protein